MAETNMAAESSASNPANITDLLAAYRDAHGAFDEADQSSVERYHVALRAVRAARPTHPRDLAAQLRWIVAAQEDLFQEPIGGILEHVAGLLEAAAMLQKGHVLFSPQDVGTIRAALLEALDHNGGSVEHEHEPGISDYDRQHEAKMRAALALLDGGSA